MKPSFRVDTDRVHWGRNEIKGADPKTFEVLNGIWACDAKHVYVFDSRLRKVDRTSFRVLNNLFAKDKDYVFYLEGIAKGCDVSTFEVLDDGETPCFGTGPEHEDACGYARDANHVYFHEMAYGGPRKLRGVEPNNFRIIQYAWATDGNRVFFQGERLDEADPPTFEVVSPAFARDKQNVYWGLKIVEDADPATYDFPDEDPTFV